MNANSVRLSRLRAQGLRRSRKKLAAGRPFLSQEVGNHHEQRGAIIIFSHLLPELVCFFEPGKSLRLVDHGLSVLILSIAALDAVCRESMLERQLGVFHWGNRPCCRTLRTSWNGTGHGEAHYEWVGLRITSLRTNKT